MVELAAHLVESVRTVVGRVVAVAGTDGEFACALEVGPLLELHPLAFLAFDIAREDEAAGGVAFARSTVRVQLTTFVFGYDIDLGEVAGARDLHKVTCLDEVSALDCAFGHLTCAVARLGAVGHGALLALTNTSRFGRAPDAKVCNAVDENILALGLVVGRLPL